MSKYASAVFELNKKNYKNGYCTFICMKLACMYSLATKGSVFEIQSENISQKTLPLR